MTIGVPSERFQAPWTGARGVAAAAGAVARRAFWVLLVVIHLVPLAGIVRGWANGGEVSSVASVVLLGAVIAFFGLKAVDLRCLRLGRSGVLAFALACVLVHGEAAPAAAIQFMRAEAPAAAAIAVALAGLTRAKRFVPRALRFLHRVLAAGPRIVEIGVATGDRATSTSWSFRCSRLAIPRGPPLRARRA